MAMAGRSHGDASGKIEEFVAIHIFDHNAAAALGNQRIRARVGRRNILCIARENALGIRARERSLELGADGQSLGGHGVLQNQFSVPGSQFSVVTRPELRAASTEISCLGWELKAKS